MEKNLLERADGCCELCQKTDGLQPFIVAPKTGEHISEQIVCCEFCSMELRKTEGWNTNHWRCLLNSMWSEVDALKVVSYRMLTKLSDEDWAREAKDMMYLEDDVLKWAEEDNSEKEVKHLDSNGHRLRSGDSVVLIKDLKVKGANFIAKRGTAVRRISLVADNPDHIEGRVNDQRIVILTQYVKKTN